MNDGLAGADRGSSSRRWSRQSDSMSIAEQYTSSMKLKTSITLSEDIVKTIDRASAKDESRSQTIERLLRESLAARARQAADARDLALINRHADALNEEAEDVLRY